MFDDWKKTYAEELKLHLAPIAKICNNINIYYPIAHDFIDLCININDNMPIIRKVNYDKIDCSIEDLRLYYSIICDLNMISQKLTDLINPDEEYLEPSELDAWKHCTFYACVESERSLSSTEDVLIKAIDKYSALRSEIVNDLKPTFMKLVMEFKQRCKEFTDSLNIDEILMHLYEKEKKCQEDVIQETTDSEVAKAKGTINPGKKDYEEYLFIYLNKIETQIADKEVAKCICQAHVIHKPIAITNNYLKQYIFGNADLNKSTLKRIISTIIKINYLKEKCGDIRPKDYSEQSNAYNINDLSEEARAMLLRKDIYPAFAMLLNDEVKPYVVNTGTKATWDSVHFLCKCFGIVKPRLARKDFAKLLTEIVPGLDATANSISSMMGKSSVKWPKQIKGFDIDNASSSVVTAIKPFYDKFKKL